ncbi:LUD domain-containing protein [Saccharopolyspora sp. NFXS83]|uniref:LutC/YkgG family protein n=1 Tax=Saccharopolyspora sp. NFXS83 TaxID=2993560 RepID=UPI00224B55D2|nr:LUD domain-containing protein [Saccharopolyspora sp. NFXS83]MCX2729527.1 LUD domain-containing protein [Saccharopolyspora sp. NFXS83]
MNARDTVLGRVRDALAIAPPTAVQVPREYRRDRDLPAAEKRELLVDRLEDYQATVHQCATADVAATIAGALGGSARVGIPAGLDRGWLAAFRGEVVVDSAEVPPDRLDALDGVVTGSAVTCAETGTIFLDASADQGRRALTLVPDLHVCVVALSAVVTGVPEAVARLEPARPTTLISGPSATSDIELDRVEGVHGPRTLHVVLLLDG